MYFTATRHDLGLTVEIYSNNFSHEFKDRETDEPIRTVPRVFSIINQASHSIIGCSQSYFRSEVKMYLYM